MDRLLFIALLTIVTSGCGIRPGREAAPQRTWMSSRYSSAEKAWVYLNFYSECEDFDRYPGYGIVHYTRNTDRDSNKSEKELLQDSLRLCRDEFMDAFITGTLRRWNGKTNGTVPFSPQYIAVVMTDFGNSSEQVGIIVPAVDLFSAKPLRDLIASSTMAHDKIWFEDISEEEKRYGYSPGKVTRYTQIEEHMEAHK